MSAVDKALKSPPIQLIDDPLLDKWGVSLSVLRLDQMWPELSGNKYFKLKYNLQAAHGQGVSAVLSFGGAFSNHIHALAMAGRSCGLNTIGMIRGEPQEALNPCLQDAVNAGMQLHFVSRQQYRLRYSELYWQSLRQQFGDVYIVPEGGNNLLGAMGCGEIAHYLPEGADYDVVALACGTGNTLAGLAAALPVGKQLLGIPVLKKAEFLQRDIQLLLEQLLSKKGMSARNNWRLDYRFHGGGYAKLNKALAGFVDNFSQQHLGIEPVYTGKLFWGLFQMLAAGEFARGTRIIAIHTGGMQGLRGMQPRIQRLLAC